MNGSLDHDRERLCRIADVMAKLAPAAFAFTLDGNEQFHEAPAFRSYWDELTAAGAAALL